MPNNAQKFLAGAGIVLATLATSVGTAGAAQPPAKALKVAKAIINATDHTPIVETREGAVIARRAAYASYSDRRSRVAATYLEGRLVQSTVNTTLYAASGACFKQEQLQQFVGLSQVAKGLLPLPTRTQRVSYELTGRTLRWQEAATKQHGVERGTVAFNGRDRMTSSHTAPYSYGHSKVEGQRIAVSYPAKLPGSVPVAPPKPMCKTR